MMAPKLIWEEVSHNYTEAAAEGDMDVGKRKSYTRHTCQK
eukprot:COSAG02_NODE_30064_length_558_cov_0.546841_1_plen_39_part_10